MAAPRRVRRLALNLLLALGILLALEGWASLTGSTSKYRLSASTGYELAPGYRGRHETVNAAGLRGAEIAARDERTLRILCMGGSTTWGHKVDDDETWPYALQLQLREVLGAPVEVLNGGVSGWGLEQILRDLQDGRLRTLQPDLVLVFSGWNAAFMAENAQVTSFRRELAAPRLPRALAQSALALRVRRWKDELAPRATTADKDQADARVAFRRGNAEAFGSLVPELVSLCASRGVRLALIRFPSLVQRDIPQDAEARAAYERPLRYRDDAGTSDEEFLRIGRELYAAALGPVEQAAGQGDVVLLDVAAAMLERLPADPVQADRTWAGYWRDQSHFTPRGNAALAEALAPLLLESGVIAR
jgi:lysophospholipase L1-like esterase